MKKTCMMLALCAVLAGMQASAQDIEAKLAGNAAAQGFTVKNNAGTSLFRIQGNGLVGIGTPAPDNALLVRDLSTSRPIAWERYTGGAQTGKTWAWEVDGSGTYVRNVTDVNLPLTITNTGNIGIGYSTPGDKLVVVNTTSGVWATSITTSGAASGNSYGLIVTAGTSNADIALRVRKQSGVNLMTVYGDGSVSIGDLSSASGGSSVALGYNASASGQYSVALGRLATATHYGSCVISDGHPAAGPTYSSQGNQMTMRFSGGYRLFSDANTMTGVYMNSGTSGWSNYSDRNRKENFAPVDGEWLLSRIRVLPVTEWNYKGTDPSIRYIGPMAQDFWQAFRLCGTDSLGINSIAIDGVNIAAIQALEKRTAELKDRTSELENSRREVAALRSEVNALREELHALAARMQQSVQGVGSATASK